MHGLTSHKQHGAAEARRAHNPEGPRSKRGVATCVRFLFVTFFFFFSYCFLPLYPNAYALHMLIGGAKPDIYIYIYSQPELCT